MSSTHNATTTTTSAPHEVENCAGNLFVYSDGTISRTEHPVLPFTIPTSPYASSVTFHDFLYDPTHGLQLRLYKPIITSSSSQQQEQQGQLPVIFYIHAGGFCIGSVTWPLFHNYCLQLAAEIPTVVASSGYRLAPEHRIPAAMEDCFTALQWLVGERVGRGMNEWLGGGFADFGRVFVAGDSAGGNIAHNLAVRTGGASDDWVAKVKGFVLLEPFFGGTVRTKSEVEGSVETFLNLELIDRFWRLSIPAGDKTDHPMVNPFGPRSAELEGLNLGPILVISGSKDLLRDRSAEYVGRLKAMGKKVEYVEFSGQEHGFFIFTPYCPAAKEHLAVIKRFIHENSV